MPQKRSCLRRRGICSAGRQACTGTEIVVACPGRLLATSVMGTIDLSRVEVLVLDEADRMFEYGVFPDVRRILNHIPRERQTPSLLIGLAPGIRHLRRRRSAEAGDGPDWCRRAVASSEPRPLPRGAAPEDPPARRTPAPLDMQSVLVFTRTKHPGQTRGRDLTRTGHRGRLAAGNPFPDKASGGHNGFRDGTYRILVATDIAARVSMCPGSPTSLIMTSQQRRCIHPRIGRTGRAARSGDAFTLVDKRKTRQWCAPLNRSSAKRWSAAGCRLRYERTEPSNSGDIVHPPREQVRRRDFQALWSRNHSPRQ